MNNVISFTPAELAAFIGTIAGVCAGIMTIVGVICNVIMRLKAPEVEQNKRIKALEGVSDIKAVLRYRLFTYFNIRLSKFSYIVHLK